MRNSQFSSKAPRENRTADSADARGYKTSVSHPRRAPLFQILVLIAGAGFLFHGAAAAAPEADTKTDESETEVQQAARRIVEAVELSALVDAKREKLELIKQPVLRFGDIPRANDKGSVWIWHRAGRP